jgi:hypothetical protein
MDTAIDQLGPEDRVSVAHSWETISAEEYNLAFQRFGGSFAVHPRVVALVASLAERPVRYAGLTLRRELIAAIPLWGEHVVATRPALKFHGASHLIDIGDSEVVLPVSEDARINIPFIATMLSSLHENNISNLERDFKPHPHRGCETISSMALAKGLRAGDHRHSGTTQRRTRNRVRRFEEAGGKFRHIGDFPSDEVVAIFTQLYEKRWGYPPFHKNNFLPTVFQKLHDMLGGYVLLFGDRPAAIYICYKHETPRWIFVNGVQGGYDPEILDHSPGAILFFHNLENFEDEARACNKTLRYCLGWNEIGYKGWLGFETPAYRLASLPSRKTAQDTGGGPTANPAQTTVQLPE